MSFSSAAVVAPLQTLFASPSAGSPSSSSSSSHRRLRFPPPIGCRATSSSSSSSLFVPSKTPRRHAPPSLPAPFPWWPPLHLPPSFHLLALHPSNLSLLRASFPVESVACAGGGGSGGGDDNNNNNNDGNSGSNNDEGGPFDPDDPWWSFALPPLLLHLFVGWVGGPADGCATLFEKALPLLGRLLLLLSLLQSFLPSPALAIDAFSGAGGSPVWEVTGGKRTMLVPDSSGAFFLVNGGRSKGIDEDGEAIVFFSTLYSCCRDLVLRLLLPEGFPNSVSSDYLEYSLWRGVQGIASQINGVLSTQALLYAVGLGKGAIPMAAAVNWVLKDGIGYLSKIALSRFGRHFDVNPKGWRLYADLLENAAYGLEIITPAFPHLFVLIGAAAGAGRSAAALIQAATRSCFYAGFAVQRNFAEVIAKGEAQGMVSKFLGIMLGIALGNYIGSSTPLALVSFSAVTGIHMYCNFKSYQSIQLRTLNPYRASLIFSQYLMSGQIPLVKEVNNEEPIFSGLPRVKTSNHGENSHILSAEAKEAASEICRRLHLGMRLSKVVHNKDDAFALFDLFKDEGYMLMEDGARFCVILKEGSSPDDMLKSLFHVNYMYWLEKNVGINSRSISEECKPGGKLQISLDYVQREFVHVKQDGRQSGWITEGLVARPSPTRIRAG